MFFSSFCIFWSNFAFLGEPYSERTVGPLGQIISPNLAETRAAGLGLQSAHDIFRLEYHSRRKLILSVSGCTSSPYPTGRLVESKEIYFHENYEDSHI